MKTITTSPLADLTREADVKTLVDSFCEKVNQDEVLSPAFSAAARVYWPQHLFSMYNFWTSVLFGPKADKVAAPRDLGLPTEGPHLQRWLNLFDASLRENFAGPNAEQAKHKALGLASLFEPKSQLSAV